MVETHILALHTYGSQRVKSPGTKQMVSAYKIGYTSAACETLLTLYGAKARDVSSPQASYRYVQIDGETMVRHGYLLLNVTADELARAAAVTRQYHRAAVYLWQENRWLELPNRRNPAYSEVIAHSGPGFNPAGLRPVAPATGAKETAVTGIRAEKSQRDPHQKPWWWLTGDTYPHRDLLKRYGARFSGKRKAWYWIGDALPAAIQALVSDHTITEAEPATPLEDNAPCSDEEAAAILGVELQPKPQPEPPRLYALNATVYARHDLLAPDGKHIPTGTRGAITRLYNRNAQHGWSYDVEFVGVGAGWYFERELTDLTPIQGIRITHGAVVPPGAVLPPTDAKLKRQLSDAGLQPAPLDSLPAISDDGIKTSDVSEAEPTSAIRIIKPAPMPPTGEPLDAIQLAIRAAQTEVLSTPPTVPTSNGRMVRIEQAYCGEMTGSITGQVFCYGWSVHEGICIFVNMAGPRMAVEAIRAKLSKGEQVSVVPPDAPAVELTAGEGNSGMYHPYLHYLPEARFASLLLVHDSAVTPNYGGKATTFIFRASNEQATAKLKHHVTQLVNAPVFDAWSVYLYEAGQKAMLVRKMRSAGGIDLLSVELDVDAWSRLITGGLEQGIISLP